MSTTTLQGLQPTVSFDGKEHAPPPTELVESYEHILRSGQFPWTVHHRLIKMLGRGGQGVVYLSERRGADGFTLPVALKIFSPEHFEHVRDYDAAMARIARVSARVAQIQQDNLMGVQDFYDRHHIRMMVMDLIDGYDLRNLLSNRRLAQLADRVSESRWEHINKVILTRGEVQPRIKPGVAVAIVRDCLAALAALHREGVVHGDIKPGNVMLKHTGTTKIIDIGSAFEIDDPPPHRSCTPRYAAPE
ncbi:MAG: protein kinase, partial [Planctomycetales bacterium]|nr:protein kinase [Planctomycetales bacterium]